MYKVLFVCLGNICRSPAGEGVFRTLVEQRGLTDRYACASAGMEGYHVGESPDARMQQACRQRGYHLRSRAQKMNRRLLEEYDLILAMDRENLADLHSLAHGTPHVGKIRMLAEYHPDKRVTYIPDPWYGGPADFEHVVDLVEVACTELLEDLESTHAARAAG